MSLTLIAFVVALGVLVAVHEWGHYRMAVACGVKVLRFSVGFGQVLFQFKPKRQRPGQDTEFAIRAIPLGGYVKMLDEREAPVPENERHLAFNTQPLKSRALIVAAGPVANLLLAVVVYAMVNWIGVDQPRAVLSPPAAESLAARVGLHGGDVVEQAALSGDELTPVASFESLRWVLMRGALDGRDVNLQIKRPGHSSPIDVQLLLSVMPKRDPDEQLYRNIGIVSPYSAPVIDKVMPDGAAMRAGLQKGDVVRRVGSIQVRDGQQLRDLIRATGAQHAPQPSQWEIERNARVLTISVQPDWVNDSNGRIGRIGAMVGSMPEMVLVRQGLVQGVVLGVKRVWEVSTLSIKLIGRMVTGQLSLKNLSGPIAIANYAGKSAAMGLTPYLSFIAFVSVSLGVLNLLPVPVLDGGHLMYYLWEAVTGKPVAGIWLERLQYVGITLLLAMMAVAMFNDVVNYLS